MLAYIALAAVTAWLPTVSCAPLLVAGINIPIVAAASVGVLPSVSVPAAALPSLCVAIGYVPSPVVTAIANAVVPANSPSPSEAADVAALPAVASGSLAETLTNLYTSLEYRAMLPDQPLFCQNAVSSSLLVSPMPVVNCVFSVPATLGAQITPALGALIGLSAIRDVDKAINAVCLANSPACPTLIAAVRDLASSPVVPLITSSKFANILTQLCSNSQARFCPVQLSPLVGLTCTVPKLVGALLGTTVTCVPRLF